MASNTKVLDTLVEMTKKVLQDAGVKLADSRRSEQQAREFLQTLLQYRSDYTQEMQRLMQEGMEATSLVNYRSFLNSIDKAITHATAAVKSQEQSVNRNTAAWQEQHKKVNSYETLIERRNKVARNAESKREQRQSDEFSAQSRLRNRHNDYNSLGL